MNIDSSQILQVLVTRPLDVYGIADALGVGVQYVIPAMVPLVDGGLVVADAAGAYALTEQGMDLLRDALVASMMGPEDHRAALVASWNETHGAEALVASIRLAHDERNSVALARIASMRRHPAGRQIAGQPTDGLVASAAPASAPQTVWGRPVSGPARIARARRLLAEPPG